MIVISKSLVLSPLVTAADLESPAIGYDNIVTGANITATSEDLDRPAEALADPSTAVFWRASDAGVQYVTVTNQPVREVDYIAIARHNFWSAQIAVQVQLRYEEDGDWVPITDEFFPADNSPLMVRFAPSLPVAIRVQLTPANGTLPQAAVVYFGKLLVMQRRIYVGHTPINMARRTRIANARSESGDFLGKIVLSETFANRAVFQNLTPGWLRQNLMPFFATGRELPFFFAWRPKSYPREVGYAWFTSDPIPENQRGNGMMQVTIDMEAIA